LVGNEEVVEDKEEIVEDKEEIDIDNMSKDDLLDETVRRSIDADYQMTKKELRELLKK